MADIEMMENLIRGGLDAWIVPCHALLIHLPGLEDVIENPNERPVALIQACVQQAISARVSQRERTLRELLSALQIFDFRAACGAEIWCPLEEPLICFRERHSHAANQFRYWRDWKGQPAPSPPAVERWLLAQVKLYASRAHLHLA